MPPFIQRLHDAVRSCDSPVVVGLDPHLAFLPDEFAIARDTTAPRADRARAIGDFLCEVIDIAAGHVPAVKPQSAFFEVFGADGVREFERVVAAAKDAGLIVIGDVKRGDIGSTAAAYATAFLTGPSGEDERTLCDAITVNPYLGTDSITPFSDACREAGAGLYVLVRTSNPSSEEFQSAELADGGTLSDRVAHAVVRWGAGTAVVTSATGSSAAGSSAAGSSAHGSESGWTNVGAVVGATHGAELERLRSLMPNTPFLIPGYGAQGGGAAQIAGVLEPGFEGVLVNSSRGILFAGANDPARHWKDASIEAIDTMTAELRAAAAR